MLEGVTRESLHSNGLWLPAKWKQGIEDKILSGVEELAKSIGISSSKNQD